MPGTASQGYDVEVRIKGNDLLSREIKKPKNAIDELSAAADPKAKRHFLSFARSSIAGLRLFTPVLNMIKSGLRGMQSIASTAFRHITRGAKIAALAAGALAGVLVKWGAAVVEAENLFKVSMGNMVKEAELWSAGLSKQLRLNQNDVKKFLGTFNIMLKSMGLGADKAFEMSKGLAQLAFDMASFYDMKPEEAFEKLQAGITGEIEPLKRLGIILNETTVKAYAVAHGIGAVTGKLTEQEKILARYGALMQATNLVQGDTQRTLGSTANLFRALWGAIKEGAQHIGKGITESKLFASALSWVTEKAIALKDAILEIDFAKKINKWTSRLWGLVEVTETVTKRTREFKSEFDDTTGMTRFWTEVTEHQEEVTRGAKNYSEALKGIKEQYAELSKAFHAGMGDQAETWENLSLAVTTFGEGIDWLRGKTDKFTSSGFVKTLGKIVGLLGDIYNWLVDLATDAMVLFYDAQLKQVEMLDTLEAKWRSFMSWLEGAWGRFASWFARTSTSMLGFPNPWVDKSPSLVDNWRTGMAAMLSHYMTVRDTIFANPLMTSLPTIRMIQPAPAYAGASGYAAPSAHAPGVSAPRASSAQPVSQSFQFSIAPSGADEARIAQAVRIEIERIARSGMFPINASKRSER